MKHRQAAPVDPSERWPHRRAAAQVFVEDLDHLVLDPAEIHHLSRVLRLRKGELVCAADGRGAWRFCELTGDREPERALDATSEVVRSEAAEPRLTVGFAPVKGDRPEWVVQKLTEMGMDTIAVFFSERSVVRWEGDRATRHLERLARVAREAAQQCRRLWLPELSLGRLPELVAAGAVLADPGGRRLGRTDHAVLVGPEGGWTDEERSAADGVDLGDNVLRAETAALAAAVLLSAARRGAG